MKGLSIEVTTRLITEAITVDCEFWVTEELKFSQRLLQLKKETNERWDAHVENTFYFPRTESEQMEETLLK
jgi:hypothetical protein